MNKNLQTTLPAMAALMAMVACAPGAVDPNTSESDPFAIDAEYIDGVGFAPNDEELFEDTLASIEGVAGIVWQNQAYDIGELMQTSLGIEAGDKLELIDQDSGEFVAAINITGVLSEAELEASNDEEVNYCGRNKCVNSRCGPRTKYFAQTYRRNGRCRACYTCRCRY